MTMRSDAFSKRHPAVNFAFFLGAICSAVIIQHPAYLAVGIVSGSCYYLLLHRRKGLRNILSMLPLFLVLTLINPLFNRYGERVLFWYFGRPYTWEALLYGMAISGIFLEMLLWFGCYNAVLTSDKFTSLFGNVIPALSLLLVMVLRLIPNFLRKATQIAGARKSIGKGAAEGDTNKEKLEDGMSILGALTSFSQPKAASSKVSSSRAMTFSPRRGAFWLALREDAPPPKKSPKMSPKSKPAPPKPPPKPPPTLGLKLGSTPAKP